MENEDANQKEVEKIINLLSELTGGEAEHFEKDISEFGIQGFFESIDSLDYSEEVRGKIKDLASFLLHSINTTI